MKKKRNGMTAKRIVINAVFIALYIVLSLFSIELGAIKITFEALPVVLCAVIFGPLDAVIVGFLSELLNQMLTFGFTPTTLLWIAPIVVRALVIGFCVKPLRKHPAATKSGKVLHYVIFLAICIVAGLLHSLINTFTLYVDSKMFGYYSDYLVFGALAFRIIAGIISSVLMSIPVAPLETALKKARLIPGRETLHTPDEAIAYIHSNFWKNSKPTLDRTRELLAKMGNPEKQLKYVHIAGTNGKGSTAAMTASILQKAGYKTGLYTSPYIYRFHERIQVNGQQINDRDLVAVTRYVKSFADTMQQKPTEFEVVCGIAFEYFKRQKCDIVVLEVGLGGDYDATNVIEVPEVAVITNIGLDHTDVLGNTLEEIAMTKAGIFKEGGHAVVYRGTPGVEQVFETVCAEKHISLKKADFGSLKLTSHSLEGQVFDCGSRKNIVLPLLGDHQLHNASVVLSIADTLIEQGWKITEENIYDGIRDVKWPGRFDIVCRKPLFIIDGGHNPQCIDALAKNIRDYLQDRTVIALTGVLADKDYGDMYQPILPLISQFVCITPDSPRKMEAQELARYLTQAGAVATGYDTVREGVQKAVELAGEEGVILCFGSLYSIGDIHQALEELLAD